MGAGLGSGLVKAFLDTHAALALADGETSVFGRAAIDVMERSALFVSPFVQFEVTFLYEIDRIKAPAEEILAILDSECGVVQSDDPAQAVVARAVTLDWTRDPFDRLLVATAMLHRAPFVTQDRRIHRHFDAAVW